ncbi:MAG: uracil-DNA glycosylase [Candidatus ainarchaeum sp.]|jgi:DNA polymerase|nr:uracil-DNA glycosylase [Candidatus ainarchaeum sp.]MDD4128650.1 uracil-DNA glycosylase [Candidatus ainarchaeum sp.]
MELDASNKLRVVREDLINHAKKHPLFLNVKKTSGHIVFGRGSDEAKVLFIGEAPGFTENETGKPFVGRSGKLLEEWVRELNLTQDDYAIMNVVPIIPLSQENKIRPPTPEEINYFLPQTMKMVNIINPKVIVLLGKSAARAFGKESMRVGERVNYEEKEMFFIYHPAYYLRNGRKGLEDLTNLKKILENKKDL